MIDIKKSLNYFYSLIDENGIIQFSKGYEKDYSYGYAIEDQARALILACQLGDQKLIQSLLQLIKEAWVEGKGVQMLRDGKGLFLNQMDNYKEASAEVLWAITFKDLGPEFKEIIEDLIKGLSKSEWSRVWAYSLLGTVNLSDKSNSKIFADKLISIFLKNSTSDWQWFEELLTYGNTLLPWSLIKVYELTKEEKYKKVAIDSMDFLLSNLIRNGVPIAVGNEGWWRKGQEMPLYGQQGIDISYTVMACLDFYKITSKDEYLEKAKLFYSWFDGNNTEKLNMIRDDGGCFDGLYEKRVNPNAGAESIICYLLASVNLEEITNK